MGKYLALFFLAIGVANADPTVVTYTVSLDSFTFNGRTYAADTFSFQTATLINADPASSILLAPATYDGYTFHQVGGQGEEVIGGVPYRITGAPFNNDGNPIGPFLAAPLGSIEGWFTPFLPQTVFDNGGVGSGTFTVAVNIRNGGDIGIIQGVPVHGTISRSVTAPEPPAWVHLAAGLLFFYRRRAIASCARLRSFAIAASQ